MTSSIHSLQQAHSPSQTVQAVQPPKTLQARAATKPRAFKDIVTISQEAGRALTHRTARAGGGGAVEKG